MLNENPQKRPSARQCLEMAWFKEDNVALLNSLQFNRIINQEGKVTEKITTDTEEVKSVNSAGADILTSTSTHFYKSPRLLQRAKTKEQHQDNFNLFIANEDIQKLKRRNTGNLLPFKN